MDSLKTRKTVSLFLLGVVIACVAYVSMRPAAARNQTMPLPPLELPSTIRTMKSI